jgi:hypothetical protein
MKDKVNVTGQEVFMKLTFGKYIGAPTKLREMIT